VIMAAPQIDRRLLGAVLCGGYSSRMGCDKATLLRPDGRSQVEFAVDWLQQCADAIVVSLRPQQLLTLPPGIAAIVDPLADAGPVAGVLESVFEARRQSCSAALCVAVDLPAVTTDTVRRLVKCWHENRNHVIVPETEGGRLQPMLSIWPVSQQERLGAWAHGSDRSLQRLIYQIPHVRVPTAERELNNVNTPEEWIVWYDRASLARD
jgi:molybdenum cofactor guanylyltransferase